MQKGSLNIIPNKETLEALEKDYLVMQSEMIYGDSPTFKEIIIAMENIQDLINSKD